MKKATKSERQMVAKYYALEAFLVTLVLVIAALLDLRTYYWGLFQGLLITMIVGVIMAYPGLKEALKSDS